jgi:hypothetical protein
MKSVYFYKLTNFFKRVEYSCINKSITIYNDNIKDRRKNRYYNTQSASWKSQIKKKHPCCDKLDVFNHSSKGIV